MPAIVLLHEVPWSMRGDPPEGTQSPALLADAAPAALFVFGAAGISYANPAAEALTGHPLEKLLGSRLWELADPADRDLVEERERARLRGETVTDRYDFKLARPDAEGPWVDYAARLTEHDGEPAVLAAAVDVTTFKHAEIALRENEARLKLAQRAGRTLTWSWNSATDELTLSELRGKVAELAPAGTGPTGAAFLELVHPEDLPGLQAALEEALEEGGSLSREIRVRLPDEEIHWVLLKGRAVSSGAGWPGQVAGVATDITEQRRAEEALSREQREAQLTLSSIGEGVIRTDNLGRIAYLNPAAERMIGWLTDEARERRLSEIFHAVDETTGDPLPDAVEGCLSRGTGSPVPRKAILHHRDGDRRDVRFSTTLIRDRQEEVVGAVLVLTDLSELKSVEREMVYLATHDGLTGLINRTEFERRLGRALLSARREGRRHALCYLDLDEFKLINDTCGHQAGDEMLRQVGSLIKCRFRESDVVGRLGGDEFGVLLTSCPPAEAREIAEGLCREIRAFRYNWEDKLFGVGVSVGLVVLDADSGSISEVLNAADGACYVAKKKGGNRVCGYEPGDMTLAERYDQIKVIELVHDALERSSFELYSQAVEPLAAGGSPSRLRELLIRLVDPEGGLVLPDAFIPVAERHRLAASIDRWVVKTAFSALPKRLETDDPESVSFAINLSGQSIGDDAFLDFVLHALDTSGIAPERIYFEITETATVSHMGQALHFISALKGRGCRFVLDDFGAGMSSFAYLANLPVDFIKIDGQFVRKLLRDPIQRALVESINHIGHVMQMKTIAESVEDSETLETLRQMKVDYAQGFWIALPEPLTVGA